MEVQEMAAIVTGGGSGLGAATARALAKQGARVTILDLNKAAAEAVAEEIGGISFSCDVTDEASVTKAIEFACNQQGPARICINCAGIVAAKRTVSKEGPMPLNLFNEVIQVNLIGTFNVLRLASAQMSLLEPVNDDGERGVVINTSSIAAFEGQIGQAAYSASKGAIAAMTLPIARDLAGLGIRVVTIAPGVFSTPMMQGMPIEVQESLGAMVPFPKRLGQPYEYAKLALHIIENTMINGEIIRLDGGIRMQPK